MRELPSTSPSRLEIADAAAEQDDLADGQRRGWLSVGLGTDGASSDWFGLGRAGLGPPEDQAGQGDEPHGSHGDKCTTHDVVPPYRKDGLARWRERQVLGDLEEPYLEIIFNITIVRPL